VLAIYYWEVLQPKYFRYAIFLYWYIELKTIEMPLFA